MNDTAYNNTTQTLHIPYTFIQPVTPSTTVHIETPEEQTIWHYDELIIAIMKVIDIQYITHCTDNQYQLITIHRAGETLIHIVLSCHKFSIFIILFFSFFFYSILNTILITLIPYNYHYFPYLLYQQSHMIFYQSIIT